MRHRWRREYFFAPLSFLAVADAVARDTLCLNCPVVGVECREIALRSVVALPSFVYLCEVVLVREPAIP